MNQTRSAHCAVRGFWISPASISWGSWISLDTPGWEEGEVFGTKLFFLHFVFSAFCASSTISFFVLLTELQERRSSSWSAWPMLEQVLSNAGAPLLRARFLEVQLLLLEHVFKSSSASIFWSAFSGVCVCVLSVHHSILLHTAMLWEQHCSLEIAEPSSDLDGAPLGYTWKLLPILASSKNCSSCPSLTNVSLAWIAAVLPCWALAVMALPPPKPFSIWHLHFLRFLRFLPFQLLHWRICIFRWLNQEQRPCSETCQPHSKPRGVVATLNLIGKGMLERPSLAVALHSLSSGPSIAWTRMSFYMPSGFLQPFLHTCWSQVLEMLLMQAWFFSFASASCIPK